MKRFDQMDGREVKGIHIGGVYAGRDGEVVRTVLGSCISVCLRDPLAQIGGMNHFMLPDGGGEEASARYGVHAMELLINSCMNLGADRRRVEAKLFGGGHVLQMRESENNVPRSNIRFALEFLQKETIPIITKDLGGYHAREVLFFTDTGKVLLKKMDRERGSALERLAKEERASLKPALESATIDDSNITLF